jgi:transposase
LSVRNSREKARGQLSHCSPAVRPSVEEPSTTEEDPRKVLNMLQVNDIRERAAAGESVAGIARELKVDEKTVRKYLKEQDYSPKPPERIERPSSLDPYKPHIDGWLEEDQGRWHKQRHTAQRIHKRLREEKEGYGCSYSVVQRYVRARRGALRAMRASQELVWHPGEAQGDFGEADFVEGGETVRKKYLTLSFPYSNDSFTQVFGGETAECVCQGLKDIFGYIGGVSPLIVFDNATGVGRRMGEVVHETELFGRMRAHYRFTVRFCNPDSGHEKGNVEAKVGYTRRNLFVPPAAYSDIAEYNRELLRRHEEKAKELHYKKNRPIGELFVSDKAALLPLPKAAFDVCRYEYVKADGYGKVRLDGRHFYSSRPENAGCELLVAVRAHTVEILDEQKRLVVRHGRQWGLRRSDTVDYRTGLAVLMHNVGAWRNSGVRELLPEPLRDFMDQQEREELRGTLRTMHSLSGDYGFEVAVAALEEAVRLKRKSFSDAAVLAARIQGYGLATPAEGGQDLSVYDQLLEEGQAV